ncbi:MAG: ATP synthase F1 subunit gamma [Vicinamibacterales bacterium]|jgi:F-type H+-transporting ATPase subunit gamma
MPSLIDMRRRIRAVKNTQQITKAMKMVAASKLRRAQERVVGTRPFAAQARHVLSSIAARVDQSKHPLLQQRPGVKTGATMLIVLTSDRGLCGSFNTNIVKAVGQFLRANPGREVVLGLVGKKGREALGRRGFPIRFEYTSLPKVISFAEAEAIAQPAIDDFVAGKVDSVHLVYNEFKSVIAQKLVVEQLLPMQPIEAGDAPATGVDYLYEPSPQRIFDELLPRLVEAQVLRALLESSAAEHAARMTAMDAATRNSAEMIEGLTLTMNKVRQAAITREIIEVVSGAQST